MCLEFSKVNNEILSSFYKKYSKLIPYIGKYIVGKSEPYDYLINSINDFYSQDELLNLIKSTVLKIQNIETYLVELQQFIQAGKYKNV